MNNLAEFVKHYDAAYGLAVGNGENGEITEVHFYARLDAAPQVEPLLRAFEEWWNNPANEGKTLGFALGNR